MVFHRARRAATWRALRSADGAPHVGLLAGDELSMLATDDMIAVLESDQPRRRGRQVMIADPETCAPPDPWTLLVPLVAPETWAAGVTYERSRDARLRESEVADVYDLVYEAQRPELFFKDAAGRRTVGPGEPIAMRSDAELDRPGAGAGGRDRRRRRAAGGDDRQRRLVPRHRGR